MDKDIFAAPQRLRVGIIGVGKMGFGIATALQRKQVLLHVIDDAKGEISDAKQTLIDAGAKRLSSPAALASACDVVLTCLPDSVAVAAVCNGPQGLLNGARSGFVHIDHTSGAPAVTQELAAAYASRGAMLCDAAMLRTPQAAAEGDLVLLTGGSDEQLACLDAFFSLYASERIRAGDIGAGQSLKLISSFVGLGMSAVIAEVFDIARKTGIAIDVLHRAISGTGADSRTFQALANIAIKQFAQEGDKGAASTRQFSLALASKDLRYLSELAKEHTTAPMATPALDVTLARLQQTMAARGENAPLSDVGLQLG